MITSPTTRSLWSSRIGDEEERLTVKRQVIVQGRMEKGTRRRVRGEN
jgi:hypothetical protein